MERILLLASCGESTMEKVKINSKYFEVWQLENGSHFLLDRIRGVKHSINEFQYEFMRKQFGIMHDKSWNLEELVSILLRLYPHLSEDNITEFLTRMIKMNVLVEENNVINTPIVFRTLSRFPLEELYFEITGRCNLFCKHCFNSEFNEDSRIINELSTREIMVLIDKAMDLGLVKIQIAGGEPFCRPDLFRILNYISEKNIIIQTIITNGTLLDKNKLKKLKDTTLRRLTISLDGSCQKEHELLRGKDTYIKTFTGIKMAINEGIAVHINTVITPYNIGKMEELYRMLKEIGVQRWNIGPLRLGGRFTKNQSQLHVNWSDAVGALIKIVEIYLTEKPPDFRLEISSIFSSAMIERGINRYSSCDHPCKYARYVCAIKPNGDCYYCPTLAGLQIMETMYGNVRDEPFDELWEKRNELHFMHKKIGDVATCGTCLYRKICGGGCPANIYNLTGSVTGVDLYRCVGISKLEELVNFFPESIKNRWFSLKDKNGKEPKLARNI